MQPLFPKLMHRFLYDQLYLNSVILSHFILDESLPIIDGKIEVFNSAVATFNAPSNISDINGMHHEHNWATSLWRNSPACYDTVLINSNPDIDGVQGFEIAHILLLFAFWHHGKHYPCALIHWFSFVGLEPDQDTGLWIVEPSFDDSGSPFLAIVHIDSIFRAVHLLATHQDAQFINRTLMMRSKLDVFNSFYINRYICRPSRLQFSLMKNLIIIKTVMGVRLVRLRLTCQPGLFLMLPFDSRTLKE